jgi:hypothetical protein
MGHQYEILYLSYERLWFKYEKDKITDDQAEEAFYKLRNIEMNSISKFKHIYCPSFKKIIEETSEEIAAELKRTFN